MPIVVLHLPTFSYELVLRLPRVKQDTSVHFFINRCVRFPWVCQGTSLSITYISLKVSTFRQVLNSSQKQLDRQIACSTRYFNFRSVAKKQKFMSHYYLPLTLFLYSAQTQQAVKKGRLIYTDNQVIKWKGGLGLKEKQAGMGNWSPYKLIKRWHNGSVVGRREILSGNSNHFRSQEMPFCVVFPSRHISGFEIKNNGTGKSG